MAGQRPQYKVMVGRANGDQTFWTQIGSGWDAARNGIAIEFNALPVADKEGKTRCILFPFEDRTDE